MIVSVQADIENEVAAAEMRERIKQEMEKVKAASGLDEAQDALNTALEAPKPERIEKP